MADRPGSGADGGGPERGTPEYDWLYGTSTSGSTGAGGSGAGEPGSSTAPRPVQPAPEDPARGGSPDDQATQVFRTSSGGAPPPADAGRGDDPYDLYGGSRAPREDRAPYQEPPMRRPVPPPGQQPPGPPPGARTQRGGRRFRFRPRYLLVLLVLWLVFILVVPVIAYFRIDRVDAFPADGRPDDQPGTNYLIVGSDSREDLSEEERRELGTGDAAGRRTDTIMLLHVGSGPNLLTSIPRDLEVDIPGQGTNKVNAAYAFGGAKLLTRTIEQNFGVYVDHYVEIGFGGFVNIIDGVGGIEICPDQPIDDPLANLRIRRAGCQEADGQKALGYARTRKFPNGDITRAENQREVVSAVGAKVLSPWSVINPVRWWRLNIAAAGSLRVSDGTGPYALGRFAFAMTRVDGENGLTCTVPLAGITNPLVRDPDRAPQFFQRIIDDDTQRIGRQLCSPNGL